MQNARVTFERTVAKNCGAHAAVGGATMYRKANPIGLKPLQVKQWVCAAAWMATSCAGAAFSRLEENVLASRVAVSYCLVMSRRKEIAPLGHPYGTTKTQ